MHQYLVQWDGDEVEVVPVDDSSKVSLADMNAWDAEGQEPISGVSLKHCDRGAFNARVLASRTVSCFLATNMPNPLL